MPRNPIHSLCLLAGASLSLLGGARACRADPPPPNPGPDVIVGDLPDCSTYGTVGTTGIFAYDIGTTSCNVGNVNLRWQASTSFHPVIAQNCYRLVNGHFDQIGMSWVKHGFFALSETLCGTCNMQGGTVLGVGCSDPYDNGLNGDQAGLGPRSEINASTGIFPYSVQHDWPPATDDLSRRLQVNVADLAQPDNTGARYFAEAIYVTPDDAPAGNAWNNASYRECLFDASAPPFPMTLTGPTHQRQSALYAWQAIDPTVRVAGCDVPGDGRYMVAHAATPNGDGTWHYEYAVLNLSSDRSGGGFTVPIAPGTTITNAGFHAPFSHSGEPYSNAPWVATIGSNAVSFAPPDSFAADPNSNALRWGTTYTFRFDASAAPGEGSIQLSLFKPGTGATAAITGFTLGARTPGGAAAAAATPVNDECATLVGLHAGENRFTTYGATSSPAPAACAPIQNDLWFSYTFNSYAPTCTGSITIDTCGSEFDTSIAVYPGPGCPSSPGTALACAGSATGSCPSSPGASSVTFAATAGAQYLVRIGSPTGSAGNVVLNVTAPFCIAPNGACCLPNGGCQISQGASSCFGGVFWGTGTVCNPNPCPQPPPPVNDECAGALAIGDSAFGWPSVIGNNFQADNTVNDVCDFGASGLRDVWYQYVPAQTGDVVIDTCQFPPSGSLLDTLLTVHQGDCPGPLVACNDNAFNYCVPGSRVTPTLTAGVSYYIRVAGYTSAVGDFVLRVTGGGGGARGACCWGSACVLSSPGGCSGTNRAFAGLTTTCNPVGNGLSPCCAADFNHAGGVTVQDIFDFLAAWFAGSPSAAYGGNGFRFPTVQDIFDFLGGWFAGCS